MTIEELRKLASHAARRTAPQDYSLESVDKAFADGLQELCSSINNFMKNRYDIYNIIIENADAIVPNKVMEAMGSFAEIRNVKQGDRPMFKRGGLGRNRAKKFLTQVGLSGVYETFRLDSETFTVNMKSIGGAVSIDFERMLDGAESLAEFMDVLTEAQVDGIYAEVQNALMSAVGEGSPMPLANQATGNYRAEDLQRIVNTVKAYGGSAVIFAAPEFISAMGPDAIVAATSGHAGVYSQEDIENIHKYGVIKMFRGTPVVEIKQSFLDESNSQVMINPQYAYILPTGKEKIVKIVREGETQIRDFTNADGSLEVHTYCKIGVGLLSYNNWGVYCNTSIDASNWYNDDALGVKTKV